MATIASSTPTPKQRPFIWASLQHPIYWLESRRRARYRGLAILRWINTPIIFAVAGLAIAITTGVVWASEGWGWIEYAAPQALGISIVAMVIIQLVAGATVNILMIAEAAPLISGEVELQSWRLLRTTTLPLNQIIYAKLAAALASFRGTLIGLMFIRAASLLSGWLLFAFFLLREVLYYSSPNLWQEDVFSIFIPIFLAGILFSIYYLSQPAMQFLVNGAIGLFASAHTRARGPAIAVGMASRLLLWVGSILVNVGVFYGIGFLFSEWGSPRYSMFDVYQILPQPTEQQVAWTVCLMIGTYALAILVGQIGLSLVALGLTQRRARRLGV